MSSEKSLSKQARLVKSALGLFPGAALIEKNPWSPFGLAAVVDNSNPCNAKDQLLIEGAIQDGDILQAFEKRIKTLKGRTEDFVDSEGTVRTFPVRSRWNTDYNYPGYVARQLQDQMKGLNRIQPLLLTLDQKRIHEFLPDWWAFGTKEGCWRFIGKWISKFENDLRQWCRRNRKNFNFIGWVIEPHESGFPHVHMLFYGSYIAPLDVLISLWPYSQPQGVSLGARDKFGNRKKYINGQATVRYLTKYLSKDLQMLTDKAFLRIGAYVYFYKVRLYNFRHLIEGEYGGKLRLVEKKEKTLQGLKWLPRGKVEDRGNEVLDEEQKEKEKEGEILPNTPEWYADNRAWALSPSRAITSKEWFLSRGGVTVKALLPDPAVLSGWVEDDGVTDDADRVGWSGNLSVDLAAIEKMPVLYPVSRDKPAGVVYAYWHDLESLIGAIEVITADLAEQSDGVVRLDRRFDYETKICRDRKNIKLSPPDYAAEYYRKLKSKKDRVKKKKGMGR